MHYTTIPKYSLITNVYINYICETFYFETNFFDEVKKKRAYKKYYIILLYLTHIAKRYYKFARVE
jgi:hypothetical protein